MAVDKLVDSTQLDADLTSVANAIRTKGGTSAQLAFPSGFISAVENIHGGASKGFLLLDTITVSENIRAVNIDFSDYQDLDFYFVVENVNTSESDWLYYLRNGDTTSGGSYDVSAINHYGVCFIQINRIPGRNVGPAVSMVVSGLNYNLQNTKVDNLYIYTYVESKKMVAGSKFYICGGNYADL